MRVNLFPGFLLLLMLFAARTCLACDCVTLTPEESFRRADTVFEGQVVRSAQVGQDTAYTFAVNKSLKGSDMSEVIIFEGVTNCNSQFSPDVLYRVYAHRFQERLTSGVCSGNQVLETKEARPLQIGWQNISPWQCWYVKIALIVSLALLLCLLIRFLPRKSRHSAV